MHLRRLERKDAPLMLEWMHDRNVIKDLNTDFASKTIDDCCSRRSHETWLCMVWNGRDFKKGL